jgi:RNA recognition motif-containing protein
MSEERTPSKNSQIFIAKLHPSVNEKDLKYKFQKFGDVKDIRLKTGYAFIV